MSVLPPSVLFACSHNSIRSPMAEGLAKRLYGNTAYMESVGVHAGALDSFAAAVLDVSASISTPIAASRSTTSTRRPST